MTRLRITIPDHFDFHTEIDVRISDINYGGHVGNDTVLSLVHEARVRYLHHYELSETMENGTGLIMTDAAVVYRSQAFQGERLKISMAVTEIRRAGFYCVARVTECRTEREVARVRTGLAFFDYENRRVVEAPERFDSFLKLEKDA